MLCLPYAAYSQCSDAGICTLAHTQSKEQDTSASLTVALLLQSSASAKQDEIRYTIVQPEIHYSITNDVSIHGKFPYSWQKGPQGRVWGIGDPLVSGLYRIYNDTERSVYLSAGVRITFGNDKEQSLPQAYQSSLGATDYLFGAMYSEFGGTVTAGYQFAGGRNNNITQLERGDDVLFGLNYSYQVMEKLHIKPEVLFIKRLSESTTIDTRTFPYQYIIVPNSAQTQLNIGLGASYMVNKNSNVRIYVAFPTLKREVNVDGLTRAYTISVGYEVKF